MNDNFTEYVTFHMNALTHYIVRSVKFYGMRKRISPNFIFGCLYSILFYGVLVGSDDDS